jgi:hypothetical protein
VRNFFEQIPPPAIRANRLSPAVDAVAAERAGIGVGVLQVDYAGAVGALAPSTRVMSSRREPGVKTHCQ